MNSSQAEPNASGQYGQSLSVDPVHTRYYLAALAGNEGLWDWNCIDDRAFFSARFQSILGFHQEELTGSSEHLLRLLDSTDRERLLRACGTTSGSMDRENKKDRENTNRFETECRILHADGTQRWIQMRCIAVHEGGSGRLLRVVGTICDVTLHRMRDSLTGLQNRASLIERLNHRLSAGRDQPFAILFVDLDAFKRINDGLSHWHGDVVLVEVARRISSSLGSDPACFGARLGSDEFVVVLDNMSEEDVAMYTMALHRLLQAPVLYDDQQVFLTASIGVAMSNVGYTRPEEILQDADIAMCRARKSGRAKSYFFTSSLRDSIRERTQLEADLHRAITDGGLVLHYQPKVLLSTGAINGFEALIRWNHPTMGLLYPSNFIPIAEESELILGIGRWTMLEAIRQASAWRRAGILPAHFTMAVNLSARQFADYGLVDAIRSALVTEGLRPRYLDVEVTESALIDDKEMALSTLLELKQLGVGLELDDFGMGYSSLSYLHRFPFDTLKIDRSFVSGMGDDDESSAITRSILALGAALNMRVVAEGVETGAQSKLLESMGCLYGQGYYFSKPLPADECVKLLIAQLQTAGSRPGESIGALRQQVLKPLSPVEPRSPATTPTRLPSFKPS